MRYYINMYHAHIIIKCVTSSPGTQIVKLPIMNNGMYYEYPQQSMLNLHFTE